MSLTPLPPVAKSIYQAAERPPRLSLSLRFHLYDKRDGLHFHLGTFAKVNTFQFKKHTTVLQFLQEADEDLSNFQRSPLICLHRYASNSIWSRVFRVKKCPFLHFHVPKTSLLVSRVSVVPSLPHITSLIDYRFCCC